MTTDQKHLDQIATAKAWANITIKEYRKKLFKYRIGESNQLLRSFSSQVTGSNKLGVSKIQLAYLYYGMFVDMGVGRGTTLNDVGENKISRALNGINSRNRRAPKPWYSKTMETEMFRLQKLMQEKFGDELVNTIKEVTREPIVLHL